MDLINITHEKCQTCGAITVEEARYDKNEDDDWREMRRFQCGATVVYSPDSKTEAHQVICPKHPDVIFKIQKRKKANKDLLNYAEELDVDYDYKIILLKAVSSV